MKLPRFRLGTVVKVVVVINLAGAMLWGNLGWRSVVGGDELSLQDAGLTSFRGWDISVFYHPPRIRGWPRSYQAQSGTHIKFDIYKPVDTFIEDGVEYEVHPWTDAHDPAALRFNIAVCVSIFLGVVLVMSVLPRLVAATRTGW